MLKNFILTLTILFLLTDALTAQERFAQLKKIEVYEIKPGILLIPRYTASNEVCEIGIERLQYSPTLIRLNTDFSREELFEILDEQVPLSERGQLSKNGGEEVTQRGESLSMTTKMDYENVIIRIYSIPLVSSDKKGSTMKPIVATVIWKNRQCR